MRLLQDSNVDALKQTIALLGGLSDQFYSQIKVRQLSGAGSHVRHILDHYRALEVGCNSGLVDYDKRNRDCATATDRSLAMRELSGTADWLCQYDSGDKSLDIRTEVAFEGAAPVTLKTSLSRELCYLLNHTVHHTAYIALLVKHAGQCVNASIGVAPASRTWERKNSSGMTASR